jgi:hypothetical protein
VLWLFFCVEKDRQGGTALWRHFEREYSTHVPLDRRQQFSRAPVSSRFATCSIILHKQLSSGQRVCKYLWMSSLSQILEHEVYSHLYKRKGRLYPSTDRRKPLAAGSKWDRTGAMLYGPVCIGHSTAPHPQQHNVSKSYKCRTASVLNMDRYQRKSVDINLSPQSSTMCLIHINAGLSVSELLIDTKEQHNVSNPHKCRTVYLNSWYIQKKVGGGGVLTLWRRN